MSTRLCLVAALMFSGLASAGCGLGGPAGPTETPTLSSEDVLRTAEAMAEQTRQAASPTPSATPITPTPTEIQATNTPSLTPTPSQAMVTARYNANVRAGPDEQFEQIDFLLQGQSARVMGRYEHASMGTWWFITRETGLDGWIWSGAVEFSGDESSVPHRSSPPTPTPGATATSEENPTPTLTPTS